MRETELEFDWFAPYTWIYNTIAVIGIGMILGFCSNIFRIWMETSQTNNQQATGAFVGLIFLVASCMQERAYKTDCWLAALEAKYPAVRPKMVLGIASTVKSRNKSCGTHHSCDPKIIARALVYMKYSGRRPTSQQWQTYNIIYDELVILNY